MAKLAEGVYEHLVTESLAQDIALAAYWKRDTHLWTSEGSPVAPIYPPTTTLWGAYCDAPVPSK